MNIVAIIPARMGSSRFPGKPMAKILGLPMIAHVYFRTRSCSLLSDTYVATCDKEIYDYIVSIDGKAVMTADTHERCTDRTAEAMLKIEKTIENKIDIVIMVQGDEPMVTSVMIKQAVEPLINDNDIHVVNIMGELNSIEDFEDSNEVKVVIDKQMNALYFSREPIPSRKKGIEHVPMYKQVCIIPFRRDYLLKFNEMPETVLEQIESVDMLRILENGQKVRMVYCDTLNKSVDTPEDLEQAENLMRDDPLLKTYMK